MNMKSVLTLGVGFVGGWAARSLADSPQDVGVKLLEIAMSAKHRLGAWAAVEGERLEDMLAEARSRSEPEASGAKDTSGAKAVTNGAGHRSGHRARTVDGEA
jgi:hypothetical protein